MNIHFLWIIMVIREEFLCFKEKLPFEPIGERLYRVTGNLSINGEMSILLYYTNRFRE